VPAHPPSRAKRNATSFHLLKSPFRSINLLWDKPYIVGNPQCVGVENLINGIECSAAQFTQPPLFGNKMLPCTVGGA